MSRYQNYGKVILSLCDFSGTWSYPYREAGYDVRKVDLRGGHDVRLMIFPKQPIHGVLAAPPCTTFSLASFGRQRTDAEMCAGLAVVDACLRIITMTKPQWWALENPVGTLQRYLGPPQFLFQPHQFGDPWTKRTALWGAFKAPEEDPVPPTIKNWTMSFTSEEEKKSGLRSKTPAGFAKRFFEANP